MLEVNPVSMKAMVTDGMVKPLSYYGTSRHEFLPDIPTTEEQGFALPSTSSVHGYLWIRRSAPDEAKAFWRAALQEALSDPENEAHLEGLLGVDIEYLGGADLEAAVQEQFETRARLIEEHGISRK